MKPKRKSVSLTCSHCGWKYTPVNDEQTIKVPTHDWPVPCRQVCPGTGRLPQYPDNTIEEQ